MDWSIQEIARLSGTTSRTLRHYDDIGLLPPSRIGANGYRHYDQQSLARLQRILLLRELGLGLPAIAGVLDGQQGDTDALTTHLRWLRQEKERLDRQIAAVETTIIKTEGGEQLMAEEMFDGFDHTQYKEEVEQRWGADAYAAGDRWWRKLTDADKAEFGRQQKQIQADYAAASAAGEPVGGALVQEITKRQHDWIRAGWQGRDVPAEAMRGLGQMYVDDPRFGANYGGVEGATYVRDAMAVYADRM
ncbi:DNA-binding transcriptional MerR regulator [Homoserinimonas aerilata]|uniref:DNA-binding transcriptional MerR regulator n=1 Tax=Homoserinimonas aerilata TaxID=1162970 RepID=A0A542XX73_9MICO|nr:MerR family transcriptional regulator [Homoserinimonas aerilata]TQL40428.1 DNA-binding transcriptional MerR regulator [Homoserinimonas aerilata]